MEVGEMVAKAIAQDKKDDCWFCEEPPKGDLKNKEKADPEDSNSPESVPENKEGNDSSLLGKALIASGKRLPQWKIKNTLKPKNKPSLVVPGAHHCIPGEASMAKAEALHKFMREGDHYDSDIGYDVNSAENGVWLPGNYAVREDNDEFNNKTWTKQTPKFRQDYVKLAMQKASGKMFHDAHRTYNGKVKTCLLEIANKLSKPKKGKCPICGKDEKKKRPPYGLVGRLHGVSGDHRQMLVAPTKKTVGSGYYTSSKGRDVVLASRGK